VAERQVAGERRDHDQQTAHRRRALLGDVVLGTLLANLLAVLLPLEEGDEARPDEDREHHRDERGDDHARH